MADTENLVRRVVLLETDERAGLVAALADACAERAVSLEISTGPGHVLITFAAGDPQAQDTLKALRSVPGVSSAHAYTVAAPS
ncbi:MAG TPA: hypothetical protein VFW40_03880 [Capsulimonadaceae bacterium]|nr:hypothetical protein [Capsulimonadaceae bacterium]